MNALVEAARAVAERADAGQPCIDHPARAATRVTGDPLDEAPSRSRRGPRRGSGRSDSAAAGLVGELRTAR